MHRLLPAIPFLFLTLSSCVIDTSSHNERSGRFISRETLEQIQSGRSRDFVLALLGDPTSRSRADEKTEIWRWEYRNCEHHSGSLVFVIDSDKTTETRSTTYVLFEDGQVAKAWQD
jgi:outer membrane protein assembly factor BamE (lipoprotein component of BamABCDE complex)